MGANEKLQATFHGKTRNHSNTLPTFQASCACGWVGKEWSFQAPVREEQERHECGR